MSRVTIQKRGVQSGAKKSASTRHPFEPAPGTRPVPGAYGKEQEPALAGGKERQIARETEKQVRKRSR
jgi:hypothetical protein